MLVFGDWTSQSLYAAAVGKWPALSSLPWQLCAFIEFQVYEQDVNGLRKARDKDGQREKCWDAARDYNQVAIVPELWIILHLFSILLYFI